MNFFILILLHVAIGAYAWIAVTQDITQWLWWGILMFCAVLWTSCFNHLIGVLKEK